MKQRDSAYDSNSKLQEEELSEDYTKTFKDVKGVTLCMVKKLKTAYH